MKLVEQGRVDLKAPVRQYLPDFRVQDERDQPRGQPLASAHAHARLGRAALDRGPRRRGARALRDDDHADLPQLAPAGAVWSYNNAGFSLAGRVIEVVTGRNIHDALRELVFAPLGISRTFTRFADAITYRVSLGHREQAGARRSSVRFKRRRARRRAASMTSIADLMRYAQFHLGDGAGADGKPFLPRALIEEMRAPQLRKNSTDDEMGVGWHLRRLGGVLTAAHGGTLNGHCLLVQLVPARRLAFAILTNHTDGWRLIQDVEHAILRRYEGLALRRISRSATAASTKR